MTALALLPELSPTIREARKANSLAPYGDRRVRALPAPISHDEIKVEETSSEQVSYAPESLVQRAQKKRRVTARAHTKGTSESPNK